MVNYNSYIQWLLYLDKVYYARGDKPSILSLNDEFFGGEGNLEVRANVIFTDEEGGRGLYVCITE